MAWRSGRHARTRRAAGAGSARPAGRAWCSSFLPRCGLRPERCRCGASPAGRYGRGAPGRRCPAALRRARPVAPHAGPGSAAGTAADVGAAYGSAGRPAVRCRACRADRRRRILPGQHDGTAHRRGHPMARRAAPPAGGAAAPPADRRAARRALAYRRVARGVPRRPDDRPRPDPRLPVRSGHAVGTAGRRRDHPLRYCAAAGPPPGRDPRRRDCAADPAPVYVASASFVPSTGRCPAGHPVVDDADHRALVVVTGRQGGPAPAAAPRSPCRPAT